MPAPNNTAVTDRVLNLVIEDLLEKSRETSSCERNASLALTRLSRRLFREPAQHVALAIAPGPGRFANSSSYRCACVRALIHSGKRQARLVLILPTLVGITDGAHALAFQ